jgi:hypothetical protein
MVKNLNFWLINITINEKKWVRALPLLTGSNYHPRAWPANISGSLRASPCVGASVRARASRPASPPTTVRAAAALGAHCRHVRNVWLLVALVPCRPRTGVCAVCARVYGCVWFTVTIKYGHPYFIGYSDLIFYVWFVWIWRSNYLFGWRDIAWMEKSIS